MFPLLLVPALMLAAPAKPGWLTTTPVFPGRVYGVGVAPANNTKALAIHQATDNAKAKVLERLQASIDSDTTLNTTIRQDKAVVGKTQTESASRTIDRRSKVTTKTQAKDLPGLTVETTFLDEDASGSTMYALAYLDMAVANQEAQARYDSVAASLGIDTGDDVRAKIHRTRVLKTALGNLTALEDLFSLIRAGGADPALGEAITKLRVKTEREREDLRRALTFGMPPSQDVPVDPEVRGAVRTAFLQEGLGWSDQSPDLAITLRVRTARNGVQAGQWWDYNRTADFIVAQGTLSLTLVDAKGQEYESTLVEAKGVGTSEFQAETLLLKDYKNKLTKTVGAWLMDLGK